MAQATARPGPTELACEPGLRAGCAGDRDRGAGRQGLSRPLVVPYSSGPQSTSIQLVESASDADLDRAGASAIRSTRGPSPRLLRLAIPAGIGDQAPLIRDGRDAVTLTSAGELAARSIAGPAGGCLDPDPRWSGPGHPGARPCPGYVRREPLQHGPAAYVPLAGKLIPGWAIALLAIALLAPVAIVSIDGLARASRRERGPAAGGRLAAEQDDPLHRRRAARLRDGAGRADPGPRLPLRSRPIRLRRRGGGGLACPDRRLRRHRRASRSICCRCPRRPRIRPPR